MAPPLCCDRPGYPRGVDITTEVEAFGKAVLDEAAEEEANLKERVAEGQRRQRPPHGRMAAEKKENALMENDIQRKKRVAMRERPAPFRPN